MEPSRSKSSREPAWSKSSRWSFVGRTPPHHDCRSQAPQDMLMFVDQDGTPFPIDFRSGHDVVFGRRHDLMGIAHQPFLVVGHCRRLFRSRNSLVSLGERGSSSNPLYSAAFARYCSAVNMLTIFSLTRREHDCLSATDALCWVIRTVINCIWGRWRRSAIFIFDEQSYGAALPEQFYTDAIDQRAHASPGSSRRSHARRGLRQCTMRSRAGTRRFPARRTFISGNRP